MPYRRLIVDGYCLLHRTPDLARNLPQGLTSARQRLVRLVEQNFADLADRATVVFDCRRAVEDDPFLDAAVEVVLAPPDQTADTVIERIVHAEAEPSAVLVVTSDQLEAQTVSAAGAEVMSCAEFLDRAEANARRAALRSPKRRGPTLGDFFPAAE